MVPSDRNGTRGTSALNGVNLHGSPLFVLEFHAIPGQTGTVLHTVPQTPIAQFLLALLGSLGLVLVLFGCFAVVYRRHIRKLRLSDPSFGLHRPPSRRGEPMVLSQPARWIAIRSSNTNHLRNLFGLNSLPPIPWSEALNRSHERTLFVSPPVQGWTLVIGGSLPDPADDVDSCFRLLVSLSQEIGEVQFFAADRVLNHHSWARLREGRVLRAYAWSGVTEWNQGSPTADERLLGMQFRGYGEESLPTDYGEVSPEQINTERILLLARRWSLDPMIASEMILQQEHWASSDDDDRDATQPGKA